MKTKKAPRNRSKKQRTMPNIPFLGLFVILGIFITAGLIGHSDYQYAQLRQASDYCQNNMYNAAPDFDQCVQHQMVLIKNAK